MAGLERTSTREVSHEQTDPHMGQSALKDLQIAIKANDTTHTQRAGEELPSPLRMISSILQAIPRSFALATRLSALFTTTT